MNLRTIAALLGVLSISALAHADAPPDIVRRKDGGLLRGTISEMSPNGEVVIVLATGEHRRMPMSEVDYAGPDAAKPAPAAPAGPTAPVAPTVPVSFAGDAGIRYELNVSHAEVNGGFWGTGYRYEGTVDRYVKLCTSPCTAALGLGPQSLRLRDGGGDTIDGRTVTITGPSTIATTLAPATTSHIIGGVVLAVGVVGGAVLVAEAPVTRGDPPQSHLRAAPLIAGIAGLGVGAAVGLGLLLRSDQTIVTLTPGIAALRGRDEVAPRAAFAPTGATLGAAF